jgi:ATP-binding protein involved in chromosome partitioning
VKIAIPTENGLLCPHFGHCQLFTIIDVNPESKKIEHIEALNPPPHDIGVLPAWLHEIGCTHIIAGGMGGRAVALFQQNGVQVICGAPPQKPEDIVTAYLNNKLAAGNNLCGEPGFEHHGHEDCGNH